jgi:hypothetical protein
MSVSNLAMRRALRTRLLTLSVCTTGSTTLGVTATGYTRASGSFVDDGFLLGQEVVASGFAEADNNGTAVVTAVTASTLTVDAYNVTDGVPVDRALEVESEASARTLSVGLPVLRAWENIAFDPPVGVPWVKESLVGGPSQRPGIVGGGHVEVRPTLVVHVHAVEDTGAEASDSYADALLALFAPSQPMTLSTGDTLRVRGDTGPYCGSSLRLVPGFATVPVTVPLRLYTLATIS